MGVFVNGILKRCYSNFPLNILSDARDVLFSKFTLQIFSTLAQDRFWVLDIVITVLEGPSMKQPIFGAYCTFEQVYINSNRNDTQIYKNSVRRVYFSVKLLPRGNIFTFNRVESSIRLTLC
jgi:hypothetical protein